MNKREIPEVNMGSMADIAFLLLIFFLVTTTMDTDSGLLRILPPPAPDGMKPPEIRERNVLVVLVNRQDQLMVEKQLTNVDDLRDKVTEFLINPSNDVNLPEKEIETIPFLGDMQVTKGVISLRTDRGTSYKAFITVLNEITAAGNAIKNDFSLQHFGEKFEDLPKEKREAVLDAVPCVISEAEPRNVGAN